MQGCASSKCEVPTNFGTFKIQILGNFCKGVKIFNFSCEINFGQLQYTFGDFLLVTL